MSIAVDVEAKIRESFSDKTVSMQGLCHYRQHPLGDKVMSPPEFIDTPHYGLFLPDRNWASLPTAFKKGYTPHTIEDVVALAKSGMSAFDGDSEIKCHWRDGHYIEVAPSQEYRRQVYGTSDNVFPRMYIRAGYDGKAFSASLGWYRDACQNLSMLQSAGHTTTRKLRHTGSLLVRIDSLVEDFRLVASQWNDTVNTIQEMESRQVNFADFLRAVYPPKDNPSKNGETIANNRIETILTRLLRENASTGRPQIVDANNAMITGWQAYNAVQSYVLHNTRRKNNDLFDRAILSFSDSTVKRAEELALSM